MTKINIEKEDSAKTVDELLDFGRLFAALRRQFFVLLFFGVLGIAFSIFFLKLSPSFYTAAATVLVSDKLAKVVDEISPASANIRNDAYIMSEIQVLKSARIADAVSERLNLVSDPEFLSPPPSLLAKVVGGTKQILSVISVSARESLEARDETADRQSNLPSVRNDPNATPSRLLAQYDPERVKQFIRLMLLRNVAVQRVGRSYAMRIVFRSHDPELAAKIANAYAEAYINDQLIADFEATQKATDWMQTHIEDLRVNSQLASKRAEDFRAENGLTTTQGVLVTEQQLAQLNTQLTLAKAETVESKARYDQFKNLFETQHPDLFRFANLYAQQLSNTALQDLTKQLDLYQSREQELITNFGADHPQVRSLRLQKSELDRRIVRELEGILEGLNSKFEVNKAREQAILGSVEQATGQNSLAYRTQVELRGYEQKAEALNSLYQSYLSKFEDISNQETFTVSRIRLISSATPPTSSSSPRTIPILIYSLFFFGMIGLLYAVFREYRERFFRIGSQIRQLLGQKFLGYLPIINLENSGLLADTYRLDVKDNLKVARMFTAYNRPNSIIAETLRSIRIAGDIVLEDKPNKVIGFTSVLPGEGKSTTAANFAALLTASGARVLLIDGDLRNPGLTIDLSAEVHMDIVDIVVDQKPWREALQKLHGTELSFIGCKVKNRFTHTSELLSSKGMIAFFEEIKQYFDYIIVDLPPAGPIIDANAANVLVDAYVMVVEWGKTPRQLVMSYLDSETTIPNKLLGVILNKVNLKLLPKYSDGDSSEQFLDAYSSYYR